ncbi:phosphopantothenoylcysteine decarboxylase isoform X6 [Gopherus flavomarginatus]|uniref:phosphopantothenoylcysteine decarboxylase isoform X6 n=1 Tax=Gopherus flavomarginatus TaxID=286002 RepID=UPI0021CC0C52|nr:phosphopantothenoylcysteine decarboxylase isoform X6 [Gopherus flavomarginatus]
MEPLTLSEPQPSPQNSLPTPQKTYHVLVGVTGSVAALKLPVLVSELLEIPGLKVRVVTTERAKHFYNPQEIPVTLYSDAEEWQLWKGRTDPVLHIDLRRWADLMLVAPLDANTLAKIANGICDNLLVGILLSVSEFLTPPSQWKDTRLKMDSSLGDVIMSLQDFIAHLPAHTCTGRLTGKTQPSAVNGPS